MLFLRKVKFSLTALTFLSASLILGCRMEDKFIYYPDATIERGPGDIGLAFDEIFFASTDGVRLHGWFVPYPEAETTLLWFHGNAGNISHRLENLRLIHDKMQLNVFIFDYRGYGRSAGRASEEGTYRDGEAAVRYLHSRKDVDPKKIVFFGRSLGAAVATDLAAREECLALILESPFASVREMARVAFPFFPIGRFLSTRYDVVEKIKNVRHPLLVLHGDRDEVIPYAQGRKVFEAAQEPKEFYTIFGAHHNDTYVVGGDPYFDALKNFVNKAETRP